MFPSEIEYKGKTYKKKVSENPLPPNIRRIKRWGYDSIMTSYGFDINALTDGTNNFQAIGLYNKDTNTCGGISNFIKVSHSDMVHLYNLQVYDGVEIDLKMNWLVNTGNGKRIYWGGDWRSAVEIKWGTIGLGGNFVQVEGYETLRVPMRNGQYETLSFARLVGFKKSDWNRPLFPADDDIGLLASGLVHRAYCVGKNNALVDSPKRVVYTPFYDPRDWKTGQVRNSPLYIPEIWLE